MKTHIPKYGVSSVFFIYSGLISCQKHINSVDYHCFGSGEMYVRKNKS